ncbi:hypothetical protein MRB53_023712 [Persea americana]|uniref:Uncharacterized protein n=1 Tax=Persea americana TaxID=3435 RepID=A0ACC2LBG6_PERAE|nr:hypothetical protein MRB53_023712 [Persea americana]
MIHTCQDEALVSELRLAEAEQLQDCFPVTGCDFKGNQEKDNNHPFRSSVFSQPHVSLKPGAFATCFINALTGCSLRLCWCHRSTYGHWKDLHCSKILYQILVINGNGFLLLVSNCFISFQFSATFPPGDTQFYYY